MLIAEDPDDEPNAIDQAVPFAIDGVVPRGSVFAPMGNNNPFDDIRPA